MSTIAPPPKPINPVLVDSEGYIDQQIRRTRRSLKLLDLAAGLLTLLIGLLAFMLVGALIDHWIVPGGLSSIGRGILFGAMLAGVAWYGWKQFVPLLKPINPVYAAQTIERSTPSLKNSLLNLLLFRSHRNYVSVRVYHALEQQTAVRLSTSGLDSSIDRSALLKLGYVLLGVIALCAAYAVLSPKSVALSTARVLAPWADLTAPSRVQILDVMPGKISVARGERVDVSAEIHGLSADEPVRLHYSTSDQRTVDETIRMERPTPESRRFETSLPRGANAGVDSDVSYWIEAGDARSRQFKISVFTRPTLVVQRIHYSYPAYTGLPSKETNHVSDIRGVEGTTVTISALANQPIKSAAIDFDADGTNDLQMQVEGNKATKSFKLELRDDRRTPVHPKYALRFTAVDGRSNADPPVHSIEVTPDYGPEVRITEPEAPEQVARLSDVVPIGVEARDPDYGLKSVTIVGRVDGGDDRPLLQMIDEPQTGKVVATRMFSPADAGLKPGDVLEYWAVAEDTKPVSNMELSEHRRLKIIGPDRAQNGKQPPNQGNRQPEDGQKGGEQGGEGGQGGAGGEGGESSEGDDGQEQPGDGGSNGGQGKGQSGQEGDQGESGAGGSGGNDQPGDAEQESEQTGENGGGSSRGAGENSDANVENNSNGARQGGQNQQGNNGQSSSDQGAESQEAGGQDSGEAGGAGGKVSSAGDEDATAMQRMMEHFNKKNGAGETGQNQQESQRAPTDGEPQGGEGAQPDDGQNGQQQPNPGDSSQPNGAPQSQGGEGAQRRPDDDNGDAPAGEADQTNGSAQGANQSASANGANQESGERPAGEGADAQAPNEPADGSQQQNAGSGQNTGKREGPDQARQARPGDGDQEKREGDQSSPDSAMNEGNGESGAGHSTGEEQGAPGSDGANRQGTEKEQQDNRQGREDNEAPVGSPDKKESDSEGGVSGEQSGGGQEGAGQKADASGKGGAGQHEAANEGAGRAEEQGAGETGSQVGDQQKANGKTGQSSDNQAGNGSRQGETGESGETKPGEQPSDSGQQNGMNQTGDNQPSSNGGEQNSATGEQSSEGSPQGDQGNESADGGAPNSSAGANQPHQQAKESGATDPQQGDRPPNDASASGSSKPMGGAPNGASQSPPSAESGQLGADEANLDYAREQTNLVLEGLDQQLAKKQVDHELLKELGWTQEELQRFVDRWKNLKARAEGQGGEAADAQAELDEALSSLGLRKEGPLRFRGSAKADDLRANDAVRVKPPSEYADRVREYTKGISSQRSSDK